MRSLLISVFDYIYVTCYTNLFAYIQPLLNLWNEIVFIIVNEIDKQPY